MGEHDEHTPAVEPDEHLPAIRHKPDHTADDESAVVRDEPPAAVADDPPPAVNDAVPVGGGARDEAADAVGEEPPPTVRDKPDHTADDESAARKNDDMTPAAEHDAVNRVEDPEGDHDEQDRSQVGFDVHGSQQSFDVPSLVLKFASFDVQDQVFKFLMYKFPTIF